MKNSQFIKLAHARNLLLNDLSVESALKAREILTEVLRCDNLSVYDECRKRGITIDHIIQNKLRPD